jgi:hypothetical protein
MGCNISEHRVFRADWGEVCSFHSLHLGEGFWDSGQGDFKAIFPCLADLSTKAVVGFILPTSFAQQSLWVLTELGVEDGIKM